MFAEKTKENKNIGTHPFNNLFGEVLSKEIFTIQDSSSYSRMCCAIIFQSLKDYRLLFIDEKISTQNKFDGNEAKAWLYNDNEGVYSISFCCSVINHHLELVDYSSRHNREIMRPQYIRDFIENKERFLGVITSDFYLGASREYSLDELMVDLISLY